jgi:beta-glucosidase
VVLVLGENESVCREGWGEEHRGDRDSLDLPGRQEELARRILALGRPTAALLLNGRPLAVSFLAENCPALMEGWYLGQEGGAAFADALFGDVNPGGRLPITIPRSVGQIPAYYNHKPSRNRSYVWTETSPLYPFGHGLSYTVFRYGAPSLTPDRVAPDGSTVLRVEVTNAGERAGDEVVQLYIRDRIGSVTRPVKELKGFARITLGPGETRAVEFVIGPDLLAFYGPGMRRIVEPGEFDLMVGGSSADVQTVTLTVEPAAS